MTISGIGMGIRIKLCEQNQLQILVGTRSVFGSIFLAEDGTRTPGRSDNTLIPSVRILLAGCSLLMPSCLESARYPLMIGPFRS